MIVAMDGVQSSEAGSSLVSITVLSVTPMRAGRLFALASVEIDIDGVRIEVHGLYMFGMFGALELPHDIPLFLVGHSRSRC
jgi:hypothetical protein